MASASRASLDTVNAVTAESAQLRAVGTAFLMKRPFIVAPGIVLGVSMFTLAGVPKAQLLTLGPGLSSMFVFFCVEAWVCRSRTVSARWLAWSLHITLAGITFACAMSGGVRSPFLPLALAPVVVAFAAFGRRPQSASIAATFVAVVLGLLSVPRDWPWPPVPRPYDMGMTAVTVIVALVLAYVGVAQLSDALGRSRESLLRMREDALRYAMDRLRSQETMRETLAHELKNPLASIKGLAQLSVADAEGQPSQRRFEVLLTAVDHMQDVLDEYLSFARPIGALELADVDVDALLEDARELVSTSAVAHGVEVEHDGGAGRVRADRRRVLEAVLNVLTNAIEASPSGGVVRVSAQREQANVLIRVADRGPGLSAAMQAKIGTPYFTTKAEGTGLGVVIATAAMREHGGELRFSDNDGRGTIATLRLPIDQPSGDDDGTRSGDR